MLRQSQRLLIAMFATLVALLLWSQWRSHSTMLEHAPAERAAKALLSGVRGSLAALRGWVAVPIESLYDERREVWRAEVHAPFTVLKELGRQSGDAASRAELVELAALLDDLEESQWWIEEVAHSPGNEPAEVQMSDAVTPIAAEIDASLALMLDIERTTPVTLAHRNLFAALAALRAQFDRTHAALEKFVDRGAPADLVEFRSALESTSRDLEEVQALSNLFDRSQADLFALVRTSLPGYRSLAEVAVSRRNSSDWNVACDRLDRFSVPISWRIEELLGRICVRQEQLVDASSSRAALIGQMSLGMAIGMLGLIVVTSRHLTRRTSERLVQPISVLAQATRQLGFGTLDHDVPVTSDDEVGQLTRSFNDMRSSLHQAMLDRDQALAAMNGRHQYLKAIIENAGATIVTLDTHGMVLTVNGKGEALFGYARELLTGMDMRSVVPSFDKQVGSNDHRHVVTALHRDGHGIPIDLFVTRTGQAEDPVLICIVHDLTEREAQASQLRWTEGLLVEQVEELRRSNKELDDFAYIASHDLKEPLRGIHNYAGFLREDYAGSVDANGQEMLATLQRLTKRMEDLINGLLYFSRLGRTRLSIVECELGDILEGVLESLEFMLQENQVEVHMERPLPRVRCDSTRVGEVFRNLITNAAKYSDKPERWIEIGWEEPAGEGGPIFHVRDNGIGIREEQHDAVFGIFKRLHARDDFGGGTGAGLSIAQKIVELHEGEIWVESEVGKGSTFKFTLHRRPGVRGPEGSQSAQVLQSSNGAGPIA